MLIDHVKSKALPRFLVVSSILGMFAIPALAEPIHDAARSGNLQKVRQLIEQGSDVTRSHRAHATPLHQAAMWGHVDVAALLLGAGADPNAVDPVLGSPLSVAAFRGNDDVAALLLSNGADAMVRDIVGKTPLHVAAERGHPEIVELLVAAGADVNARAGKGFSATHSAGLGGHFDMIDLLRAFGAVNQEVEFVSPLLATANPGVGETVFRAYCINCHSFEQGGPVRTGPNLWGILGSAKAGVEGFEYSATFNRLNGTWSYAELNAFLAAPFDFAPGTKMDFEGVVDAGQRADLIVFLRRNSDELQPLPATFQAR